MQKNSILFLLFILGSFLSFGQTINDSISLRAYILSHADEYKLSKEVLNDPNFRLQLAYTQIEKSATDTSFNTITFGTHQYFYPASLVKLPAAILALEKMNRLGLTLDDRLLISDGVDCRNMKFVSVLNKNYITFRQLFEELMIVSDNNFYSALYHFLTPKEINDRLSELGFSSTHIYKSFSGCKRENQLKCNPLKVTRKGVVVYSQDKSELDTMKMLNNYTFSEDRLFGSKHEDENVKIVDGPFDMNYNLELPLNEVHEMLVRLQLPSSTDEELQFSMREEDRLFLLSVMKKFPRQLRKTYKSKPRYRADNYYKYAIVGEEGTSHKTLTTSKLGLSYGFTSEAVYVDNPEDEVSFFMSVSLYTNANDIVNDGVYEYEEVARVFIARLSKMLYDYELSKY